MSDERTEQLKVLARKFDACGCKQQCVMEQWGDDGPNMKPRGRYSVCELEADAKGVKLPKRKGP